MISKMSEEQEKQVPVYLKKWLDFGYRTETVNRTKATAAVNFLYEKIMKTEKPKYVIFLDSPMACQLAFNLIKHTKLAGDGDNQLESQLISQLGNQLGNQLISELRSQLGNQLGSQLRNQLESQLISQLDSQLGNQLISELRSQLGNQLGSQLRNQLGSQLGNQLESQLRSQLESQLGSQLGNQLISQLGSQLESQLISQLDNQLGNQLDNQLDNQLGNQLDNQLDNQLESQLISQLEHYNPYWVYLWYAGSYYGFYDFVLNELFPEQKKNFSLFTEFVELWPELHYFLPFKDIVLVSDFPKEINLNDQHMLHKDGGSALLYRDTYSLFRLNGVSVSKEIAKVKPDQITKEMILKEENADVRREIIRKIGIAKAIEVMGAETIDSFKTDTGGQYDLLMIDYDQRGKRPYLKMKCSSSGEVFILGSKPGITTAKEAWQFLNSGLKFEQSNLIWEA